MSSATLKRYNDHLRATSGWLLRSIDVCGGSRAHYSPLRGWSAPYPETTGYIIPTLLDTTSHLQDQTFDVAAHRAGEWLLSIQFPDGCWPGGLSIPGKVQGPSVFNTAQILDGMVALARSDGSARWYEAAARAANWLASGVNSEGLWMDANYRSGVNPSYYTQVAWPMLQAWQLTGNEEVRLAAERVLRRVLTLRTSLGAISGWSFDPGKPAFTHTIAYTLRGLIESAYLLNDWGTYGAPCEEAIERLVRMAEFTHGRLPGAYHEDWRKVGWYTCLTGNVQIALCLMRIEQRAPDLRLINAAAKLVDQVCSSQHIKGWGTPLRGAVAGSSPLWGRYMFFRYPNWAAKYHSDALMMLTSRLQQEGLR